MTLTINVTEEHIQKGLQGCSSSCAVALALLAILDVYCVSVSTIGFRVSMEVDAEEGLYEKYELSPIPENLIHFISGFDEDKSKVEPSEFTLELTKL